MIWGQAPDAEGVCSSVLCNVLKTFRGRPPAILWPAGAKGAVKPCSHTFQQVYTMLMTLTRLPLDRGRASFNLIGVNRSKISQWEPSLALPSEV